MVGLRTHLDTRSKNYFALVQEEAKRHHHVFFLNTDTGLKDLELDDYSLFHAEGWLVPFEIAADFEKKYLSFAEKDEKIWDEWLDYLFWAHWEYDGNSIKVIFRDNYRKDVFPK